MPKIIFALLISLFAIPIPAAGAPFPRLFGGSSMQEALQARLASLDSNGSVRIGGAKLVRNQEMSAFYKARAGKPAWFANGRPSRAAWQSLDAIRKSPLEGLDADAYHVRTLDTLLRRFNRGGFWRMRGDPTAAADLELVLTDGTLRLARHLLYGRVRQKLPQDAWHVGQEKVDLPVWLSAALEAKRDMRNVLQELVPADPGYGVMKYWLAEYRRIEAAGGWPKVPEGPSLGPKAKGPRVSALCARLAAEGYLPAGDCGEEWFPALGGAVNRYQAVHGMEPTGTVAEKTLKELNLAIGERIEAIELNLDCWRWLPRELGARHVRVNIADYRLGAWDNGKETLSMRVVVGRKEDSTPVFSDSIQAVQLNPSWNVPPSIAKEEILPELMRDPSYLASHEMELLAGWGANAPVIQADTIDWSSVDTANFKFRIRQRNGDASALGRIKFVLANPYNIYLHDTPSKRYFERHKRALSHGCVRLAEPMRLAGWVLGGDPEAGAAWPPDKLAAGIAQGEEKIIPLSRGIPTHILYWTCFPDNSGGLQFRPDVYGWNRRMERALAKKAATF